MSHFYKSCSSNDVNAASRLSKKYADMRAYYIGGRIDDSYKFDAELVENVIHKMKQESVRPRWPYDMRPSVRAEKYIRDASG